MESQNKVKIPGLGSGWCPAWTLDGVHRITSLAVDSIPKFSENVGIESMASGFKHPLGTVPHPPSPGTSLAVDSIPTFSENVGIESTV